MSRGEEEGKKDDGEMFVDFLYILGKSVVLYIYLFLFLKIMINVDSVRKNWKTMNSDKSGRGKEEESK